MSPRWRKVASDLWANKTRTALVVLSIAVGVFAVGMISGSGYILTRSLATDYAASRPSSATIYTNDPFDDDLVNAARQTRGVREAEGRHALTVRVQVGSDEWRQLRLFALAKYSDVRVNKVTPDRGVWPPPHRQIVVERSSVPFLRAHVGDRVIVTLRDGKERELRIAGVAHDLSQYATRFIGIAYGYITSEAAEWLREPPGYNELYIVAAGDPRDKANVERVTKRVQDKVEGTGRTVFRVWIQAGKHWADDSVRAVTLLLGVLGFFSLLLSGFLVVNTISSIMAQQVRQIGVMKAIGARSRKIMAMYLATTLAYCVLALLMAVPLGALGARAMSNFTAKPPQLQHLRLRRSPGDACAGDHGRIDRSARAQLGVARAQAAAARQQQRLVLTGPRHEEIDAVAAEVRRTRAQLALLEAGTSPEAIAAAEADVAVARANLRQAQEALALTELRAPLNGVVTAIVAHLHEFVAPGSPIVRLADTAAWEIETTDLSDLNIARVREGDPVVIAFDGIPGLELTGRVIRIQGFGETKQGDIVYKATIKPDRQDVRFRWNMTASVTITPR